VKGEIAAATPLVAQVQKRAPGTALAHNLQASLLTASNERDRARRSYLDALQADGNNLEALRGLVNLDLAAGKKDEAIQRIEAALAKGPRSEDLLIFAAAVYARTGQTANAEKALREVVAANPARLVALGLLGQLYADLNRLDEAVKQFEAILARDPQSASAHTLLGAVHERRRDTAAAEKAYQSALGHRFSFQYRSEQSGLSLGVVRPPPR
jgi:tetratricopeptide (TPR) repeat protein